MKPCQMWHFVLFVCLFLVFCSGLTKASLFGRPLEVRHVFSLFSIVVFFDVFCRLLKIFFVSALPRRKALSDILFGTSRHFLSLSLSLTLFHMHFVSPADL